MEESDQGSAPTHGDQPEIETLDELVARHIEAALRMANGRVEGRRGAAKLLGINPHTLRAKMKKMGIKWRAFREAEPDDVLSRVEELAREAGISLPPTAATSATGDGGLAAHPVDEGEEGEFDEAEVFEAHLAELRRVAEQDEGMKAMLASFESEPAMLRELVERLRKLGAERGEEPAQENGNHG